MSKEIIKKHFKEENNKIHINLPILHRQVATYIIYDKQLDIFIDGSEEINNILRIKAYLKECSKEYLKKYDNYKNYKKLFYLTNIFKRIMRNKLPEELYIEQESYTQPPITTTFCHKLFIILRPFY